MTNIGIFVCAKCAGLHRELNHKVKGIGMCTFSAEEVEFLKKWGNDNAEKIWLRNLKKSGYPVPSSKEAHKLKEYMKAVYEQKRFYAEESAESSSESGSDDDSAGEKEEKKVRRKPAAVAPKSAAGDDVFSQRII